MTQAGDDDPDPEPSLFPDEPNEELDAGLRSNLQNLGALGDPDANGIRLPPGFSSRIVAKTDTKAIESSEYVWHIAPDGGATYRAPDGGWIYVSNSEIPLAGGAGALRFDSQGQLLDAYAILAKTNFNCAGGRMPWGTWLSCEESEVGRVFECDPLGEKEAVVYPGLGVFKHEACALDPASLQLYLTEDTQDGCLYRFTASKLHTPRRPDFSVGILDVAIVDAAGGVTWQPLPDPTLQGMVPTRYQVEGATAFRGGEGIWYRSGTIFFTTKGDNRVWAYRIATKSLTVIYDRATAPDPSLSGVDNITVTCCGDVLVAEDGGDMEIAFITPQGRLRKLLQVTGQPKSEITGPAFSPSGTRLYFSSQRGLGDGGITYEITGPFHI